MNTSRTLFLPAALLALSGCAASGPACTVDSDCRYGTCVDGHCVDSADDAGATPFDAALRDANIPDAELDSPLVECGGESVEYGSRQQNITIPNGVRYLHIKAWGGGGNGEGQCRASSSEPDEEGGPGGFAEANLPVMPGDVVSVIVGGGGSAGRSDIGADVGFGFWGGGGLSGVFSGGELVLETDAGRALVVAGGGGSAAVGTCSPGIPGNHAEAGGMPTMAGEGSSTVVGGGGGYFGGSAGVPGTASRGGTGFVIPWPGRQDTDFRIEAAEIYGRFPPRVDDPDYDPDGTGLFGRTEHNGRVVIHYLCEQPPALI